MLCICLEGELVDSIFDLGVALQLTKIYRSFPSVLWDLVSRTAIEKSNQREKVSLHAVYLFTYRGFDHGGVLSWEDPCLPLLISRLFYYPWGPRQTDHSVLPLICPSSCMVV